MNTDEEDGHRWELMDRMRAFNGLCLAIVQSTKTAGTVRVTARAEGLAEGAVKLATP